MKSGLVTHEKRRESGLLTLCQKRKETDKKKYAVITRFHPTEERDRGRKG